MAGLIVVQNDAVVHRVIVRGRFTVTREQSLNERYLTSSGVDAAKTMVESLEKRGYRYVNEGFDIRGPLLHIIASDNTDPDPGPNSFPDIRDAKALAAWNRLEKDRTARDADTTFEYVDFIIEGTFERKGLPTYSAMPSDSTAILLGMKGTND